MKINLKLLLFSAVAALITTAAIMSGILWYITKEPTFGGNFILTYKSQPWELAANSKKLNLLYIGYMRCPDVCPMALSYASQAFKQLSPQELEKVQLIFLSVDYQNDKPDDVAGYAAQFFPSFVGLSGSEEQINKTVSTFKASYMVEKNEKSYLGYSIAHTDRIYFLNSKGIVLKMIASPRDSDLIVQYIKEIL